VDEALSGVIAKLPLTPGVYRFRDVAGRVLYVGRATVLRRRVASYWSDLRDRRHLAPMVAQVSGVEAVSCDSAHEAAWLERNLLTTWLPPWNRTAGGQEHPVYIRMNSSQDRPGMSVAHVLAGPGAPGALGGRGTAVYFGPYLGGGQVRRAVKGLGRVLPLAYTGAGLRGTRLDIARARGFAGADRDRCAATITAVLRRHPKAVRDVIAGLEELRDRASAKLAFELAGEIDRERRAVKWVTSPQRASSMDDADFTASGWAGGILTSFTARRGRVCEWAQSRCPRADAAAQLVSTPPSWADFAQRNAQLAAALSACEGGHIGEYPAGYRVGELL
jgi:excinuclease ABC subunit C